jgi:hypothetical protein
MADFPNCGMMAYRNCAMTAPAVGVEPSVGRPAGLSAAR